jgi:hypothetical protein
MNVHLLTPEQAEQIKGVEFMQDNLFNPTQDNDDNWFVSVEEVNQCVNDKFMWVKELPLIPYTPKQYNEI